MVKEMKFLKNLNNLDFLKQIFSFTRENIKKIKQTFGEKNFHISATDLSFYLVTGLFTFSSFMGIHFRN